MAGVFVPPKLHSRAFMVRTLNVPVAKVPLVKGYQVKPWENARIDEVAQVQFDAYAGTLDQRLFQDLLRSVGSCREHLWQSTLRREPFAFTPLCSLLLLHEDAVVGFTVASMGKGCASLDNIAVHPAHRGGTGQALLVACLGRMRKLEARSVTLTVTTANKRAVRVYRKLGFFELARTPIAVPHGTPHP